MTPPIIGIVTFTATFGGALFGMWVSRHLPSRHLGNDTRDAISLSMAVVGTLAALVLGLLLSQASASFGARAGAVTELSANILRMDRVLQRYGPEAADARVALREYARQKRDQLAGAQRSSSDSRVLGLLETVEDRIDNLRSSDDLHRDLRDRAVRAVTAITDERWLLVEKRDFPVPTPFLVLLVFWLTLLFGSFGLFAPRNGTVITVLFLCSLAVAGGVSMILELGSSDPRLIRVPLTPLSDAVAQLSAIQP